MNFPVGRSARLGLLFCSVLVGGAASQSLAAPRHKAARAKASAALGAGREIESGVVWNEVRLKGAAGVTRLWIYRPTAALAKGAQKFPVVFIAPAGTPLYFGMRQGRGDTAEQLPYARAGFIVVAYEIDGEVADSSDEAQVEAGVRAFATAGAGVADGKRAINYALAHVPRVDPRRLYVAGHSSAATLSLQMAQHDPRIAACVAYAPCTDLVARLSAAYIAEMDGRMPGFARFITGASPINNAARLRCPTFLFHADDDSNVPLDDNAEFARVVHRTNPRLQFVRVASGGHYESMIQQGIPAAIRWLQSRPETAGKQEAPDRVLHKTKSAATPKVAALASGTAAAYKPLLAMKLIRSATRLE